MDKSRKRRCCFFEEYERLTLLQNSYPLPYVTSNKKDNSIDLHIDRIQQNEWDTILAALRKDNTLRSVILKW